MEKKFSNVALIRFRTLVLRAEGRGSKRKLRELSFLSDIDILTLPLRIMISNKNICHLGCIGHQYWGATGHCPKVLQPSTLPHQAAEHSESLLQFDIGLKY